MTLPNKSDFRNFCIAHVDAMIAEYEGSIQELKNGMFEETKSSAGDKYETSRTQFQREIERLKTQISSIHTTKASLLILSDAKSNLVGEGSLLHVSFGTTNMVIYIGAALGSLEYQRQSIHVISGLSPLAIALKGHTTGNVINFNQKKYKIEELA